MNDYTKGPYKVGGNGGTVCVYGANDSMIAACGPSMYDYCRADAERIRLCLTCHDQLLAAIRAVKDWLPNAVTNSNMTFPCALVDLLNAAIAAAEPAEPHEERETP